MKRRVITPTADLRETPDDKAPKGKFESQLVYGEIFIVEKEENGWCRGTCAHDGYAGWIKKEHLGPDSKPTHLLTAHRSVLYQDATIKSPAVETFSFGSRVTVTAQREKFAQLDTGAWIYLPHMSPLDALEKDHVATAVKFLETPYYWGGRSGFGIDCSGLVQVSLAHAGIKAPRDTEEQIKLGATVDRPRTSDLVFFKGHVGIMVDDDNLLHANAHHMQVTAEPLWQVEERSGAIVAVRRV